MESLYEAIYNALITDANLIALVPVERIRRGWNEPVEIPTVRFTLSERKSAGDDQDNKSVFEETIAINILADGDLECEPIADAVMNALRAEAVTHENLILHHLGFLDDNRGVYFDPIRKRHRKDLSFIVIYSGIDG